MQHGFERFESGFEMDPQRAPAMPPLVEFPNTGFRELLTRYSGCSFNKGLYRIVNAETVADANLVIAALAPHLTGKMCCFAYDWSGILLAVDPYDPAAEVTVFDPGTGKVQSPEADILTFHNQVLVDNPEGAFGSVYGSWLTDGGLPLKYKECLGFKIPLFLGGQDSADNLEISDISVYWHISGQLFNQTRGLAPGTKIRNVSIGPAKNSG